MSLISNISVNQGFAAIERGLIETNNPVDYCFYDYTNCRPLRALPMLK